MKIPMTKKAKALSCADGGEVKKVPSLGSGMAEKAKKKLMTRKDRMAEALRKAGG